MRKLIAGLDVGTTNLKVAIFDLEGRLVSEASAAISISSPNPGWEEQNPLEWWSASCAALKNATLKIDVRELVALGLTGQCPGHVLVDNEDNPLGSAIIWRDQRAQAEAAWLAQNLSPEKGLEWAGRSYLGDPSLPPTRLMWLNKHRREDIQKSKAVLQPKDFIGLKLTGHIGTDVHSAYCLFDTVTGSYHPAYFDFMRFPVSLMPQALQPTDVLGKITPSASELTGLPSGLPVVCGTIDAYCDNLAAGAIVPGIGVDVCGTSEVISLGLDKSHAGTNDYLADLGNENYFLCGPTQAGSDTLRWFSGSFYPEFGGRINFKKLEEDAAGIPAGCDGLVFLPYLNGERAPLWDSNIRGGFIGLSLSHQRPHFTRSVYEGVAFVIRQLLEFFEETSGQPVSAVLACGGGSRSIFWNQLKADILQKPVSALEISQTGALGAAILASVSAGLYPDLITANQKMMRLQHTYKPDPTQKIAFDHAYRVFRELYPALKPIFASRHE